MQDRDPDAEWVERVLAGDRGAFDDLVRRHFRRLYVLLFRLAGNHEDAEDMTQECFTKAYESLAYYRSEASFFTWLARIGLHLAHDRRRLQRLKLEDGELDDLLNPTQHSSENLPDRKASRRELALQISEALRCLPQNLRVVMTLRLFEQRSYDEVAELTGGRPGTVRTQVMRARKLLLERLSPWLDRSPRP